MEAGSDGMWAEFKPCSLIFTARFKHLRWSQSAGELFCRGDDEERRRMVENDDGKLWMAVVSVLQGSGGVHQIPYLGGLRESQFDTTCIINVK